MPCCLGLQKDSNSTVTVTNTIINMPNKTLPDIPVPKDKIDAAISIPLKMGLIKNSTHPDGMINIAYKEEWEGGSFAVTDAYTRMCVLLVYPTQKLSDMPPPV